MLSSRSARRSNSLQDASSDPVAKASPLGKNLLVSWGRLGRENSLLDGIDIGLVAGEGLDGFACSDIPDFGSCIASTRYKEIGVGCERDTASQLTCVTCDLASLPHNIPRVIIKLLSPDTLFDIPEHTRHVTRTSNNPPIIDKSTSRQVPRMSTEFSSKLHLSARPSRSSTSNRVNGTDVVQSTTSDKVAAWRICTSHDPT